MFCLVFYKTVFARKSLQKQKKEKYKEITYKLISGQRNRWSIINTYVLSVMK